MLFSYTSCLSSQRYNFLKANHNRLFQSLFGQSVVYQVKDTIFWKQITTISSISFSVVCCLSSQRYNFLKANHNYDLSIYVYWQLFIKSKIQFSESKSQQHQHRQLKPKSCLSSQRYNFLKANHNTITTFKFYLLLFIKSKIQFSESKSQQLFTSLSFTFSCLSSQRYNFLN